jgi:hypothetical protein
VRSHLVELGIKCGKTHNPSRRVDPSYWRFFVSSNSYKRFTQTIGSMHPRKKTALEMVI